MRDRLYDDPALAAFYDVENGWGPDTRACAAMAADAASVLDLGCGTGLLVAALSDRRIVVGVDPAGPMLDIARARPGGERCRFIEADARDIRLGERFDLVVMTGHAFQVFLTPDDRAAVLATIATHLAPDGRFVFDSRNPRREEWREWTQACSERVFVHPEHGAVRSWNDVERDDATGVVAYGTHYALADGRVLSARSAITFPDHDEILSLCVDAGLAIDRVLGDWAGTDFHPDSLEIIPVGRLAR